MKNSLFNKANENTMVNNSSEKAIGVQVFLDKITKAEPFQSLFKIQDSVLAAIKDDIENHGYDVSKPVNLWKTPGGALILVDGYTRVRALEELGELRVMANIRDFATEEGAVAYAFHTQRDRRNLTDADLVNLVALVDKPQTGFHNAIAAKAAIGQVLTKSSQVTAEILGVTPSKIERVRAIMADNEELEAVKNGEKSISRASLDAKAKRRVVREVHENVEPTKEAAAAMLSIPVMVTSEERDKLISVFDAMGLSHKDGYRKMVTLFLSGFLKGPQKTV